MQIGENEVTSSDSGCYSIRQGRCCTKALRSLLCIGALAVSSTLFAQQHTFYEISSTIHASKKCPNIDGLYGYSAKEIEIDLSKMDAAEINTLLAGRFCKLCKTESVLHSLLGEDGIREITSGGNDFLETRLLEPNEILIGLRPGMLLSTSSNCQVGARYTMFEVKESSDESLLGCPLTVQIIEKRKSNIGGSEGRLVLRPLFVTKKDGAKIYCHNSDIIVRGLNRTNVKIWTLFFPPMLFVPGTGAKILPGDRFTVRVENWD